MRRSKLGLTAGLGLSLLGYVSVVGWARRTLVLDPPLPELESALQEWLAESGLKATSGYVHTPVGRVHILVAGQGQDAVMVLAGLGASAAEFAELLKQLATDHLVVGVDLPGAGLSDPVGFRGQPKHAWEQVIESVAQRLNLGDFTLIGHSLGGLAAGGFAVSHPNRVSQLVLISPLGFGHRTPLLWNFAMVPGLMDLRGLYQRAKHQRAKHQRAKHQRAEMPSPQGTEGRAGVGGRSGPAASPGERYRRLVGMRFGTGSDLDLIGRLLEPFGLRPEARLLPGLGLLSGRVLVLWGSDDHRLPLSAARVDLGYFPGIRLEIVPGAGHLLPVLEPELTGRLIRGFLGTQVA